ncbi:MAG TPA: YfiR family protein [Acidobacteriaceae bacterium]
MHTLSTIRVLQFRKCRRRAVEDCRALLVTGCFAVAWLFAAPTFLAQGVAQTAAPTQDDVEAAYLYNFAKFVTWPSTAKADVLNICILGKDPFGPTLDQIVAGESIDGRHLAVVRLSDEHSVQPCGILFIGESESLHIDQDLAAVAQLPILTVSEISGFMEDGGTIQFVLQEDRVRFEVNLNAARKSGIGLSSQLLKVATKVVGNASGEEVK